MSKSRYSTNFQARRFCEKGKIARKKFLGLKREIFRFPVFEGKRIDFGANKPKLRRFEIRSFCDKMRPFCTISAKYLLENPPRYMVEGGRGGRGR